MAGIANALVTATPNIGGYPTVSGYTDSEGRVSLPMGNVTYTVTFSGPAIGRIGSFQPARTTFTFYSLKNRGKHSISVLNTRLPSNKSIFALPGKLPVRTVHPGTSWNPPERFTAPAQKSTSLIMPRSNISISFRVLSVPKLFAIDGYNAAQRSTNSAYSQKSNLWSVQAHDLISRSSPAAGTFANIILAGGFVGTSCLSDTTAYDTSTRTWAQRAPVPVARGSFVAGPLDGNLYLFDGYCGGVISKGSAYRSSKNSWITGLALPPKLRYFLTFGTGLLSKFYAVGGRDLKNTSAYDPSTNTWSTRASDLLSRNQQVGAVVNSRMYVIDGFSNSLSAVYGANDVYDPSTNTWSKKASDIPRAAPFAGAISQYIVVAGGYNIAGYLTTNRAYDTVTNTWSARTPMNFARYRGGGTVATQS